MSEQQQDSTESVSPEVDAPIELFSKEELLQKELQESKDKYIRLLADSENTRKRLQKEKLDMVRFSTENVIADFLTPMDNLENALHFAGQASEETANWAKGFQMILGQFKDVLSDNGITPFISVGTFFDPHLHEAVEIETSDSSEDGFILQEYVKGYKSKERIIRPARVKVVKKSAPAQEPVESETRQEPLEKE
ncbi:MAG: nucleotide exchange factor GrpE [Chlamydiota bacterium]